MPKLCSIFLCKFCDYSTSKKSSYANHVLSLKHQKATEATEIMLKLCSPHICELCEKKFSHRSGLWRHKKKCIAEYELISNNKEQPQEDPYDVYFPDGNIQNLTQLVLEVVKNNSELQKQNHELQKSIIEISSCKNNQITNNSVHHTNSHNKTFNLQVFLNETCKDAMNLTDFVDSLQIQLSDLENVGKNGFVNGISSIIMKNLKALDYTQRPVHCSDQKRETVYIKDKDQWHNDSKELPENQKLKKAIKQIAHKNICMIPEWKKKYPDCIYSESNKSDLYNHIMYESMDHNDVNSDKIIKKIAKEVVIEK